MRRTEPSLAPEWLKSVKGGTNSNANSVDDRSPGILLRNRLPLLEEPCIQRSDSNSGTRPNYSNFGRRGERRRNVDSRDRDWALSVDVDSRGGRRDSGSGRRTEVDSPWSSRSAGSGRRGVSWSKSLEDDLDDFVMPKRSSFKREFPSLRPEVKSKPLSPVHTAPVSSGLNMAETVAQAPLRARTASQLSVDTQRIDEFIKRQSKKLIPLTPKIPGLNSSDKTKSKGPRGGQEVSAQLAIVNKSLHAITSRPDASKEPQVGNFQVLKRDGTVSSIVVKDVSVSDASLKRSSNLSVKAEGKDTGIHSTSSLKRTSSSLGEKRALLQAKERHEFFNSLRKKTSVNQQSVVDASEKPWSINEQRTDKSAPGASVIDQEVNVKGNDGIEEVRNDDPSQPSCLSEGNYEPVVIGDEEEAALLKSLGWDEHAQVEAIKDEEIAAFKKKYETLQSEKKLRPLSKLSIHN